MSYLSIALRLQAERRHLNQSDIARNCGLSRSFISRLLSGESHDLSDENFTAILNSFSADPSRPKPSCGRPVPGRPARAAGTPGAHLVDIEVKGAGKAENRNRMLCRFI